MFHARTVDISLCKLFSLIISLRYAANISIDLMCSSTVVDHGPTASTQKHIVKYSMMSNLVFCGAHGHGPHVGRVGQQVQHHRIRLVRGQLVHFLIECRDCLFFSLEATDRRAKYTRLAGTQQYCTCGRHQSK